MSEIKQIIPPIQKELLLDELTKDKLLRRSNYGGNDIYIFTHKDSPNLMKELGRLREITFRAAGGGTGKEVDIDEFDTSEDSPYCQIIVWNPSKKELIGGYRFIIGEYVTDDPVRKLATSHLFELSDNFIKNYLPKTIELGRSFIQPDYQYSKNFRKGLFALDNLWDGIVAIMSEYSDLKYLFGKFTMYKHYNIQARNYILSFLKLYFDDDENLVIPKNPINFNFEANKQEFSGKNYNKDYKKLKTLIGTYNTKIPPLVNAYMNLSSTMKTFGTVENDHFGGVEETGILISIDDMYASKMDRHIKSYKPTIDVTKIYPRKAL